MPCNNKPALLAALLVCISPGTAAAQTPDTPPGDTLATTSARDAYLDETARLLIRGAKAARDTAQLGIDAYTALIRERMGVDAPTLRRDRPWVHGERVARVRWSRIEPDVVHVLGGRFRDPGQGPNDPPSFFAGLRAERFATDPGADPFLFGMAALGASTEQAAAAVRSPLAPDSERHYQFRSGDTLTVEFSGERRVEAVAVTVIPRVRSIRLISAIMWIEPESMAVVRVAYRLAKRVDREISWQVRRGGRWAPGLRVDIWTGEADSAVVSDSASAADSSAADPSAADSSAAEDPQPASNSLFDRLINGTLNNLVPLMTLDITTVVAEYGFWESRHWLPRYVRWEGYIGADEDPGATNRPAPPVPMTIDWAIEIEEIQERDAEAAPGMPATASAALDLWRQNEDSISGDLAAADPAEIVTILPADRDALVRSELLPPNVWEEDPPGLDPRDIAKIASDLGAIGTGEGGDPNEAANPWTFQPPGRTLRLLRYNPVEGVSAGTRLRRDFDWGRGAVSLRIPTRRIQAPDVQFTLVRNHGNRRVQLSIYRALRGGGIADGGLGQSPGVFITSGDSTDFYWSRGVSLRLLPGRGERYRMSLRLFAESDADVVRDGGAGIGAAVRNRVGTVVSWRPWWGGLTPRSMGGGGWLGIRAALGDNSHLRAGVTGVLVVPLPSDYSVGLEAGAARVWGDPARKDLWSLGASGIWLRGHKGNLPSDALWRGRIDLQRPVSFLRLSVFGDWVSNGGDDLYAVGVGAVFMDGITRLDVAHGLRLGRDGPPAVALRMHIQGDVFF